MLSTPPGEREIEVSVFGPGFGECLVIHAGHGDWIVVDSCLDVATREPAALTYLKALQVDPSAVRRIIATHWHDDHVRGLGKLLRACANALQLCRISRCWNWLKVIAPAPGWNDPE